MASGDQELPQAWPTGQKLNRWFEELVFVTQFADHASYHPALCRTVMERAGDAQTGMRFSGTIGSAKLYDLDGWGSPEASLVHQRALQLFRLVTRKQEVAVDLSWASVYNDGDWCMPHSHPRTMASILYVLDLGDAAGEEDGRFCFADPRMKMCCREQPGYMSTPCAPPMGNGSMMMFPGQIVHFVTPYRGKRPRLTMSWNLNHAPVAGSPLPEGYRRPGSS